MDVLRTIVPNGYYRAPDFRSKDARAWAAMNPIAKPPFDNYHQNLLIDFLRSDGTTPVAAGVYEATALHAIPYARTVMSALLLARAPIETVCTVTGVSEDTAQAYSDLYFDPMVFHNRLLKTAFIQRLPGVTEDEAFYRDMLSWALQLGWEYVEWRVTGRNNDLPVVEMLKGLLSDSLWRSKEHVFNRLGDPTSKEARAWLPHTVKLAEAVFKMDTDRITSIDELRIELSGFDATTNRGKLGSEIEIYSESPA